MKVIKKIIALLMTVAFVLVILYAAVSFFAPSYVARIFGFEFSRIVSNSMEPKIRVNDMVIAIGVHDGPIFKPKTKVQDLEHGDIITFETYINNKKVKVTHYFGHIDNKGYVRTYRIDSNNIKRYDRWYKGGREHFVTPDDILGKVSHILPTRTLIRFITSGYGIAAIPSLLLSAYFFSLFRRERSKEQDFDLCLDYYDNLDEIDEEECRRIKKKKTKFNKK